MTDRFSSIPRSDVTRRELSPHDVDENWQYCKTCRLDLWAIHNGHIGSGHWTGRSLWAPTPIEMLRRWLYARLYPSYECVRCVGQDAWQGCYCAYYGCVAPGDGPGRVRERLRSLVWRWLRIEGADYQEDLNG